VRLSPHLFPCFPYLILALLQLSSLSALYIIYSSDGPQPHYITVEFPRKVPIQKISLALSYHLDDSYTPAALSIRAGTGAGDMQETRVITMDKPDGWLTFDVCAEPGEDGEGWCAYSSTFLFLGVNFGCVQ
jgi:hypothetical protein